MTKPNLFLVGNAKCGTTSMHDYLSKHPDVTMSDPKEPHYYYRDYHFSKERGFNRGYYPSNFDDYLLIFGEENKINGESSTGYFRSLTAPYLIKRDFPDAKIIIMIRNPADMLHSLYGSLLAYREDKTFREAIEIKERRLGIGKEIITPYLEFTDYYNNVKRWFDTFGRENVKVIIFEEFVKNKDKIFKELLNFLGLKPIDIEFENKNLHRTTTHPKMQRFIVKLSTIVPVWLKFKFISKIAKYITFNYMIKLEKRPEMAIADRIYILKKHKKIIKDLSKLLNKDLITLWGVWMIDLKQQEKVK